MKRVLSSGELRAPKTPRVVAARSDMLSSAATVLMSASTIVSSGSAVMTQKGGDPVSMMSAMASIVGGSASLVATAMSSIDQASQDADPEILINGEPAILFLRAVGVTKLDLTAENVDGKFVVRKSEVMTWSADDRSDAPAC